MAPLHLPQNPAKGILVAYFCAPIHSIDRAIEHITGVNNVYSAENKIYSEAVLRSLLDNNTPVTILWGHYDNSGVRSYGHYVVIFGYHWEGSRNEYVYDYYDPNPETKGESRYKSYSELCRHHDYNSLSNSDEIVLWESIITFKEGSYAQVIDRPVL